MQLQHVLGDRPLETPQQIAGLGVDRQHLVARRGDEHDTVIDDRRRLMPFDLAGRHASTPACRRDAFAAVICASGL